VCGGLPWNALFVIIVQLLTIIDLDRTLIEQATHATMKFEEKSAITCQVFGVPDGNNSINAGKIMQVIE